MLKTSFLTVALMTSALINSEVHAGILSNKKVNIQSKAVKDVFAGLKFNYFDQADRLLILNDFLKTVELEYALLPLKKTRINLDYNKLKADAIAAEMAVPDMILSAQERKDEEARERVAFSQANSNMDFLDRMEAVVAQFKDTHFGLHGVVARPLIYNGLRLYRVKALVKDKDGKDALVSKVVVGGIETKLLALAGKASGADFSAIKTGDEVIAIDGKPVEEKINELKPYIAGSSEEFIDMEAVRSLTLRDFKYEKKNFMKMQFKKAGSFKLPIFANNTVSETPRLDAITFFNRYNIPSDATTIGVNYDKTTKQWTDSALKYDGYTFRNTYLNLKGAIDYTDETGRPVMRTGYFIFEGRSYGVMQLLTFSSMKAITATKEVLPFLGAVKKFILELKDNELPLILDLRLNNGGFSSYPPQVLSMLTPEGEKFASPTSAFRMTSYTRQISEPDFFKHIVGEEENDGLSNDELKELIDSALDNRADYTPMFVNSNPITADKEVKGFNNNIIALVTANCISACDKMAALLKTSGRAVIVGSHSNGTGAGFRSSDELNTQWSDRLRVLETQVPNYLFGFPGESLETKIFEQDSVLKMCSENQPIEADFQYATTEYDVMTNDLGWLKASTKVLTHLEVLQARLIKEEQAQKAAAEAAAKTPAPVTTK